MLHQRIEPLGWFVEDRELRVVLERLDDAQLLAHSTRVVADSPLQVVPRELQPLAQLGPAGRRLALQVGQVVQRILTRKRAVQGDPAREVSGASPDRDALGRDVESQHPGGARSCVQEAKQRPDGRRLAGAVRSQEPEDLGGPHLEREAGEGANRSVVLGQSLGLDRRRRAPETLALHARKPSAGAAPQARCTRSARSPPRSHRRVWLDRPSTIVSIWWSLAN